MPSSSEPGFCRTCIEGIRIPVLLLVTTCGIIVALLLPPIAQPPGYHDFADQRSLSGHGAAHDERAPRLLAGPPTAGGFP